ncbi:MAG: acyl-CoA thioesterase [Anaerolineaceae bacterium]|nr:acyl-CoA thioesterase [Anaerolineaceae bacterium]
MTYGYKHTVKYYETDRMGFTHHSNYIRWMEEARIDFMDKLGWSYQRFEDEGLISPVIAVECKYKKPTTFPEIILIEVSIAEFRSIKLRINYVMKNEEGVIVCEGASEHCFLNKEGKLVRIDKDYPEFAKLLITKQE